MNKAMTIVGIVILGILTLAVVNIINQYSQGKEMDEQLLNETTKAAMIDAIDLGYYRVSGGIIRCDREKFLESFVRRFAEDVTSSTDYKIRILDFNEIPPKVSIQIGTGTVAKIAGDDFDIVNQIDAIIETEYAEKRLVEEIDY